MKAGLVGFFDVGRSFGLTDDAFREGARDATPDLGWVGIRNPLGNGTSVSLHSTGSRLVGSWRAEALTQTERSEIETGWSPALSGSKEDFVGRLCTVIQDVDVARCELTIYACGIVYLRLELSVDAVDISFVPGLLTCWEYAAYTPTISGALMAAASAHLDGALEGNVEAFAELTYRSGPVVHATNGYQESNQFQSFTTVIECSDATDNVPAIVELFELKDPIHFEFHGDLYLDWATCVLVPRGEDPVDLELERMRQCIRIAHLLQGTCEAFLRIFEEEIASQVGSYVGTTHTSRSLADLNRLRIVAMAIVALTRVDRVAQSEEDRTYLSRYSDYANLAETRSILGESIEVLYQVQAAEVQEERARKESVLNLVVVFIALLTLISVTSDAYNFVRDQQAIVSSLAQRIQLLATFLLTLSLLALVLLRIDTLKGPGRRRVGTGRRLSGRR